jgi:hypothetical protein
MRAARFRSVVRSALVLALLAGGRLSAQGGYYNTDAGHPLRVEDAVPTERFALELHLPVAQMDHLDAGVTRWRFEPALAYGLLPQTELEIRSTFLYREAGAVPRGGLSGISVVLMRALNVERLGRPALGLSAAVFVPAGAARNGGVTYSLKALMTKTGRLGRVHLNAAYGTYSLTTISQVSVCPEGPGWYIPCSGTSGGTPFVPDGPCLTAARQADSGPSLRCDGGEAMAEATQLLDTTRIGGARWQAGVGVDHAFALHSTIVMADLYAERFVGLFPKPDLTLAVGARHQLNPLLSAGLSLGRHFAGITPSWVASFGLTYSTPLRF